MRFTDPNQSFLIFSDSDIFVEEWDIRGNLRMCEQYDCATGFKSIVELTADATRMLRTSKPMLLTPWFDANDYSRSENHDQFGKFCVFNRKSIEAGWKDDAVLTPNRASDLRVFASPNDALQMTKND
jgi:hypothetical protein